MTERQRERERETERDRDRETEAERSVDKYWDGEKRLSRNVTKMFCSSSSYLPLRVCMYEYIRR